MVHAGLAQFAGQLDHAIALFAAHAAEEAFGKVFG
jgi:hypothetical protein